MDVHLDSQESLIFFVDPPTSILKRLLYGKIKLCNRAIESILVI
ncbi:MAG: hypothetical protein AB4062_12645 [Crocosphaera sp.]